MAPGCGGTVALPSAKGLLSFSAALCELSGDATTGLEDRRGKESKEKEKREVTE